MNVRFHLHLLLPITLFTLIFSCNAQHPSEKEKEALTALIASDAYPNIDGVLVAQNGTLLYEAYFNGFGRDSLHDTRSAFKSITSMLAGIAIEKGMLSVDDPIGNYLTAWKDDPRGNITVKNLLQMKSGLDCEEFFGSGPDCESSMWDTDDWFGYIMDIPLKHRPGLNWSYSSIPPELMGNVIAKATNTSLVDFTKTRLFDPLGITDYRWYITPNGNGYAAGSFMMAPKDMLKIAQMVLDDGKWQGKQLISPQWLAESTDCPIDVEMSFTRFARTANAKYTTAQYGYFWYRELLEYEGIRTEVLFASGNGGQYMMILKDYNAAVVFTGSNYGSWRGKLPFDLLLKEIIPML